jgi:hypothetical protein
MCIENDKEDENKNETSLHGPRNVTSRPVKRNFDKEGVIAGFAAGCNLIVNSALHSFGEYVKKR